MFSKRLYPRNLHSGERITEFVELADTCRSLGVPVVPHSAIQVHLERGDQVLKFGKADLESDLALLARHPHAAGEWNARNLEAVGDFNHYVDLGRPTWNLVLSEPAHRERLRALFQERGRLFVKSVRKGHSRVYESFEDLLQLLGNVDRASYESLDLLVSDPIEIRQIQADVREGKIIRGDEWRHHVYRKRLVGSSHAFECDERRTDDSGRVANVEEATRVISLLGETDFATTYVLDTCALADGSAAVVETNSFFSSGIYGRSEIRAIAEALAAE